MARKGTGFLGQVVRVLETYNGNPDLKGRVNGKHKIFTELWVTDSAQLAQLKRDLERMGDVSLPDDPWHLGDMTGENIADAFATEATPA